MSKGDDANKRELYELIEKEKKKKNMEKSE